MASYVVMEPPQGGAQDAVLVRDGFSFLAFIVPFLWFLWHRLWLEALAALAAMLLIGALGGMTGAPVLSSVISLCLSLFLGLEARGLRVAALRRRGWRQWGVVEAGGAADAETRYMAELVSDRETTGPLQPTAQPGPPDAPARRAAGESGPALGLFSYPGAH